MQSIKLRQRSGEHARRRVSSGERHPRRVLRIRPYQLATYRTGCTIQSEPHLRRETARLWPLSRHDDLAAAFWLDWIKAGSGAPGTGMSYSPFLGSVRGYITVAIICLAADRFAQSSCFRLPAPGRAPQPSQLVKDAVFPLAVSLSRGLESGLGRQLANALRTSSTGLQWSPFWDRAGTKKPEGRPIRSLGLQELQDAFQ